MISTGRLEYAILIPKDNDESKELVKLCFTISLLISVLFFILVPFYPFIPLSDDIMKILNKIIWFLPSAIFFVGSFNVLTMYATRLEKFNSIAKAKIAGSLGLAFSQIGLGLGGLNTLGLIIGRFLFHFISLVYIFKYLSVDYKYFFKKIPIKAICLKLKLYSKFPKYSLTGSIVNQFALDFLTFMIPIFFSMEYLGLYAIVYRVLILPSRLISYSIGQLYLQEMSKAFRENGNTINILVSTVKKLVIISTIIFGPLYMIVGELFGYVFGQKWAMAGIYAKILLPLFFVRFIISPLTNTLNIFDKQLQLLIWQVLLVLNSIIVISISYYFQFSFEYFLYTLVYSSIFIYIIVLLFIYYVLSINQKENSFV